MITTLTGPNSFLLRAELNRRVDKFLKQHGDLAVEKLDGEEVEIERLTEALQSLPFLATHKLVVIKNPTACKPFTEDFEKLRKTIPETTDVILVEPKLDKRLSFYKSLRSHTEFKEFRELDGPALGRWLVETAKSQGGELRLTDANYLIERIGPKQQLLAKELEKLLLYDQKINREVIDDLTDRTPQSTVFQLLEAAFSGNAKKALELYHEQRALRVEPQEIIGLLAWQLHVLAVVKTAGQKSVDDIAKEAKINPFVVRKSAAIARRLSLATVKQLVSDVASLDERLKTQTIDADEALQNLLVELGQ